MTPEQITQLFGYAHLPEGTPQREMCEFFHHVGIYLAAEIPAGPERTLALRKLWETKNLAVFAKAVEAQNDGS